MTNNLLEPAIMKPIDVQTRRYLIRYDGHPAYEYDAIRVETKSWPSDQDTTPVWFIVVTGGVVRQATVEEHHSLEVQYSIITLDELTNQQTNLK